MSYFGLVELGLVGVELGLVLDGLVGVAGVLGVTAGPFGVVVAPLEVEPGVIVLPVELAPVVPVVSVFEDCGTPVELAGTQFAVAVVEVLGVELGDVEEVVELLGEALLVELDDVLAVELGDALELLGVVLLVEVLGVEVVLIEPLALVAGTMPAGQLLVEDALGVVDGVDEVLAPVCDEVEVEGDVVVLVVVDVLCAATHVAHAVRINSIVSFFMFSILVISSGSSCDAHFRGRVHRPEPKKWAGVGRPGWLELSDPTCGPCDASTRLRPSLLSPAVLAEEAAKLFVAACSRWCR